MNLRLRSTHRNILGVGHSRSGASQRLTTTSTRESRYERGIGSGSGSTVVFSDSDETSDCTRVESVLRKATLDFGASGNTSSSSRGDLDRVGRGSSDGRVCVGDRTRKVRKVVKVQER